MSIAPDLSALIYDTGTVSIATGSTTLTGNGTAWLVSGAAPVIRPGDTLSKNGFQIPVFEVEADGTIELAAPWPGAPLVGATYQIIKGSPYRLDNVEIAISIRNLVQSLATLKPVSTGSVVPDNSLGEADQWYFQTSSGTLIPYRKVNDAWEQMALGGQWGVSGANVYYTAGQVLIGNSAAQSSLGQIAILQINHSGSAGSAFLQAQWNNDAAHPAHHFSKSRGAIGAHLIVQNGDPLGSIYFSGSDGTQFIRGAMIRAVINGTPGTNSMPATLSFYTTAGGSASPAERLRITPEGVVSVLSLIASTSTTTGALTVAGGLGVGGAIYAGSSVFARSGSDGYIRMETGSSTVTGWLGWYLANGTRLGFMGSSASNVLLTMENGALFQIVGGVVGINSTQASSSTTTGALTVAGGLGVAGTIFASSVRSVAPNAGFVITNTGGGTDEKNWYLATNAANRTLVLYAANDVNNLANVALTITRAPLSHLITSIQINPTTASTSFTNGALIVGGGVGIGGALNVGGARIHIVPSAAQGTPALTSEDTLVVQNNANASAWTALTIIGGQTNGTSRIHFGDSVAKNAGMIVYGHEFDNMGFYTGGLFRAIITLGLVMGAASGGDKGIGTINAVGVYDDNALLTCFGIEYLIDGKVDVTKWDGFAPQGKHQLVRSFLDMIGDDFDPRDHRSYIDKMIRDRGLPGMPTQADWQHNTLSTGEMTNRLWLSAELQASAFKSHVDKTTEMEAQLVSQAMEITELRNTVAELQATRH